MTDVEIETPTPAPDAADGSTTPPPEGEFAIVELMGHQTVVGRISEVDRFGAKFMAIEPIYLGKLLPPILQGGSSIYRCTPCTAEIAFNKGAREAYQLPSSVRATLPAHLLPSPGSARTTVIDESPSADMPDDDDPDDERLF